MGIKKRAVFLDRDGVINNVVMRSDVVSSPRNMVEFSLIPEAAQCVADFKEMGFLTVIFTNQPDISRGLLLREDLSKMHAIIVSAMPVDSIVYCPHDDSDNCKCRKPKSGLLLATAQAHGIDLERSYVVGDGAKDIEAGKAAGCKTFFITQAHNKGADRGADFVVNNLSETVNIIKKHI